MDRIVPCIMLIDDDRATTVYNEIIIEEHGGAQKVMIYNSAEEALTYLTTPFTEKKIRPDLILLDINMPRMDGWEFVEAYSQAKESGIEGRTIVMLSTTADKREYDMAAANNFLQGIKSKPLTFETLDEILAIHFNNLSPSSL